MGQTNRKLGLAPRFFFYSAAVLLGVTGVAKLVSASGSNRILQVPDPIFGLPFRYEFCVVGVLELGIAAFCLFGNRAEIKTAVVAWMATAFLVYRIGLLLVGYEGPCHCLGSLTAALHVDPQVADSIMKAVLAYLLVGSYAVLFYYALRPPAGAQVH